MDKILKIDEVHIENAQLGLTNSANQLAEMCDKNNKHGYNHDFCPMQIALDVLGGKWKMVILYYLSDGEPKRFKQLEYIVKGISPRMLIKELKELEVNQLISRKQYNTIPPMVEYTMLDYGKSLLPLLCQLNEFGSKHAEMMAKLNKKLGS